jgi:molybdate transport system substrate-binding protein
MAEFTNVTLTFNFGSSGTLQTQIEEGAPADVFLSAAQKQMDALAEKDLIIADTRRNLLVNKVVLIVPANSDKGITSFEDVATDKVTVAAIGGENVPVGDYAREVFTTLGTLDTVLAKASLGSDVRQVLSWVESGDADCGIVYATDAATTGGVTIVAEAPEGSHKAIVYPGAVIADSANADTAQAFLDYLSSPAAAAKFEAAGFTIAG